MVINVLHLSDFGEEVLNFSKDCFSSFLAKFTDKPCGSVFVALGIIARYAAWNNVFGNSAGAIERPKRDKMFYTHGHVTKKTLLISTVGATAAPPIEGNLPIVVCEVSGKGDFSGDIFMIAKAQLFKIILAVLAPFLFFMFYVFCSPSVHSFLALFSSGSPVFSQTFCIIQTIPERLLAKFLFVFSAILFGFFSEILSIGFSTDAVLFGIASFAFIPKAIARTFPGIKIVGCCRKIFFALDTKLVAFAREKDRLFPLTRFASGPKSVSGFFVSVEIFSRTREPFFAFGALLRGYFWGTIIHDIRSFLAGVQARNVVETLPGISMYFTPVIVPRMECKV